MKRELESLAPDVDLDGPRTKRRKDIPAPVEATAPTGQPAAIANAGDGDTTAQGIEGGNSAASMVKQQATRLWQTVKDAVNKEGNICSPAFMRLPSKRHYPDYYNFITQPICLDDIKGKIDGDNYPSLDEVRQDFELCFANAKRYNMKDSPIWLDAKFLLKLTNKEYTKITGKKVKKGSDLDENGEEKVDGDGDDDKKKNKPPNMNRLLKSRLQKLVEKVDEETQRVLSDVFMEMPSKKDYPTYYKQIKRPICLEQIFKRLKRKEYVTSEEFANDIELVFSNALEFNQDHSQIWEDAITLRDYFRQLMSDLPPPLALARYSKTSGKIKLKVPGMSAGATTAGASQTPADATTAKLTQDHASTSTPLTLRLPGSGTTTKSPVQASESLPQAASTPTIPPVISAPASTPKITTTPTPASETPLAPAAPSRISTPVPVSSTPAAPPPPKVITPSPQVAVQPPQYTPATHYTHYPNATYHHQVSHSVATPQPSTSTAATAVNQTLTEHSVSRSPAPELSGHRPLKEVFLTTKPRGRPFWLDHRDGVKSWAMRLGQGEKSLCVVEVKFFGEEDRDSSDEDVDVNDLEEEEEEEEPVPKKRGRGRPPKNAKAKAKAAAAAAKKADLALKKAQKAPTPPRESIQITLNGTLVAAQADQGGMMDMELQVGTNVLEVGEKGGHVWKVYLERVSIA
ncbi:Bromodomain-containing protein [Melanogaster broomeanus]|nr:Bromodomain-containing protein [Melanogaster broomeanus]